MPSMTISEKAAAKGRDLVKAQADGMKKPGLRVRVVGGGCSGLMYKMEIGDGAQDGDETFERGGFVVYIDKKSLFFLNGSELDYHDGLTGAGFRFKNPNVKGSCGCGESFHV
jgi:iron-sulfur cluster assembly accessory protein